MSTQSVFSEAVISPCDQDFRFPGDRGEIHRPRVAEGDRGVGVQQEQCHGLADDVRPSHDHCTTALDLDAFAIEQFHDPRRGARNELGSSLLETTDEVEGDRAVEAISAVWRGVRDEMA